MFEIKVLGALASSGTHKWGKARSCPRWAFPLDQHIRSGTIVFRTVWHENNHAHVQHETLCKRLNNTSYATYVIVVTPNHLTKRHTVADAKFRLIGVNAVYLRVIDERCQVPAAVG